MTPRSAPAQSSCQRCYKDQRPARPVPAGTHGGHTADARTNTPHRWLRPFGLPWGLTGPDSAEKFNDWRRSRSIPRKGVKNAFPALFSRGGGGKPASRACPRPFVPPSAARFHFPCRKKQSRAAFFFRWAVTLTTPPATKKKKKKKKHSAPAQPAPACCLATWLCASSCSPPPWRSPAGSCAPG